MGTICAAYKELITIEGSDNMRINEIYPAIQGEAMYSGIPMIFVRTEYCNLRCTWCDSKYTFTEGSEMDLGMILDKVSKLSNGNINWVCLTGGEPLLQQDSYKLSKELIKRGYKILLETSGSLSIDKFYFHNIPHYEGDGIYIDCDYKLPSSGMNKFDWNNVNTLTENDYLKMVVADKNDYDMMLKVVSKIHNYYSSKKIPIYVQPAWGSSKEFMQYNFHDIVDNKRQIRLSLQSHKIIFDADTRGV